jgi:glycine/D-amino acid oxidase-like deaminating enzyme
MRHSDPSTTYKPLVICPLLPRTRERMGDAIIHEAATTPDAIEKLISTHRPTTLIVGAQSIPARVLKMWRILCPNSPLTIIRRGSSLAAIDQDAAKKHGITLHNTPVNTPYVAGHIDRFLLTDAPQGTVTVIGVGNIGSQVAKSAIAKGHLVRLYSPTLANPASRDQKLKELGLDPKSVICVSSLSEAFSDANYVALTAALTKPGSITAFHVKSMAPNARFMSITEPSIFAAEALPALHDSTTKVILDSSPHLLAELRPTLPPQTREGFTLQSDVIANPDCQEDMDQAAMVKAAELELQRTMATFDLPPTASPERPKKPVVIGTGIAGLMAAYELLRHGHQTTVIGLEDGASHAQHCRHVSVTETVPHATAARTGILERPPEKEGWRLKDTFNAAEIGWAQRFEALTQRPTLHAVFTNFVIACNHQGMQGWKELQRRHPDFFEGYYFGPHLTRSYLTEHNLRQGVATQAPLNDHLRLIETYPVLDKKVAGTIRVDGFGFDIIAFMTRLKAYLVSQGVTFINDTVISRSPHSDHTMLRLTSGQEIVTDALVIAPGAYSKGLLADTTIPEHVQSTVGCWLTIPNPGITEAAKIHAPDPAGVINMVPSADFRQLHISGGFGFVGQDPQPPIDSPKVRALFVELEKVVSGLFPEQYTAAREAGSLDRRTCLRPMTADGISVLGTPNPHTVIITGTNSGGTVQAPWLAQEAVRLLEEGPHTTLTQVLSPPQPAIIKPLILSKL